MAKKTAEAKKRQGTMTESARRRWLNDESREESCEVTWRPLSPTDPSGAESAAPRA